MDGKDTERGRDDLETGENCHQKNYYHHSGDVTYKLLIFGCLFSTLCCLYLLSNAFITRHQVHSLQTTVDKLETQLKDVLAARTDRHVINRRAKRAIPAAVRGHLPESLINWLDTQLLSHMTRRPTTALRQPIARTTTTSRPRIVPTLATTNTQRKVFLPVEAPTTPNSVTSPDFPESENVLSSDWYRNGNWNNNVGGENRNGDDNGNESGNGNPGMAGANGGRDQNRPQYGRDGSKSASTGSGSTFTRWGRKECLHKSDVVYAGYAAANHPSYGMGGSTELQCLSTDPSWHTNSPTQVQTTTKLFAAKFYLGPHTGVFNQTADNSVITCVVCLTTKAPVIMMPGRVSCPNGWHNEYSGYLMSSTAVRYEMYFSSKNYCVDKNPEYYEGHEDRYGLKLTFLQAGSCYQNKAPCTQYVENHRIGCVVCSKVASSY